MKTSINVEEKRDWYLIILIASLFLIPTLWGLNWYLVDVYACNVEEGGQFGDRFGATTSLFGGITIILLLISLMLQRKELKATTKAIELSQKEMELTKVSVENSTIELKRQYRQIKYQRFDSTFFNLLKLNLEIIAEFNEQDMATAVAQLMITGENNSNKDEMLSEYRQRVTGDLREKLSTLGSSMFHFLKWICKEKSKDGREKYLPLVFSQLRKKEKEYLFFHFNVIEDTLHPNYDVFKEYLLTPPWDSKLTIARDKFASWAAFNKLKR